MKTTQDTVAKMDEICQVAMNQVKDDYSNAKEYLKQAESVLDMLWNAQSKRIAFLSKRGLSDEIENSFANKIDEVFYDDLANTVIEWEATVDKIRKLLTIQK